MPGASALVEGQLAAGIDAGYLGESSSKYLNDLKVALTSIRKSCPSIIPIVVVINNISVETKRWITALGAIMVKHDLTISKHVYKSAALEEWSWVKGVISTYLRIEVPHSLEFRTCAPAQHTAPEVAAPPYHLCLVQLMGYHTCASQVHLVVDEVKHLFDSALVDLQYVIWGDLDTIWVHDFDSCTLAKPTLVSVSGFARALAVMQAVSLRTLPH